MTRWVRRFLVRLIPQHYHCRWSAESSLHFATYTECRRPEAPDMPEAADARQRIVEEREQQRQRRRPRRQPFR